MNIKVNEKDYKISFQHNVRTKKKRMRFTSITKPVSYNTCCIIQDKDGKTISKGCSVVSPKDNYEKSVGRKLTLGRALRSAGFSYEERQAVWEEYRNWGKKRF